VVAVPPVSPSDAIGREAIFLAGESPGLERSRGFQGFDARTGRPVSCRRRFDNMITGWKADPSDVMQEPEAGFDRVSASKGFA
jgi:hypothetical protein